MSSKHTHSSPSAAALQVPTPGAASPSCRLKSIVHKAPTQQTTRRHERYTHNVTSTSITNVWHTNSCVSCCKTACTSQSWPLPRIHPSQVCHIGRAAMPVPACPSFDTSWTAGQQLEHTTEFHRFCAQYVFIVAQAPTQRQTHAHTNILV